MVASLIYLTHHRQCRCTAERCKVGSQAFAVMPEAARNGGKGRVDILFSITREGNVQDQRLVATSGNNALDTAAMSAIQLSAPLGSFLAEFNGEPLRLRFAFLYNLTPDSPR
jgi:TonB family protein